MILQQLWKDADAIFEQVFNCPLPPIMYDYKPLRFIIELNVDPCVQAFLMPTELEGDKNKRGIRREIPYVGRTSGVSPILLADTSEYVLAMTTDGDKIDPDKPKEFRELIETAYKATQHPGLLIVLRFLEDWHSGSRPFNLPLDVKDNDLFGFRVNGSPDGSSGLLSDAPVLQKFWAEYTLEAKPRRMHCLVSDIEADIETKLPLMIKGLVNSQGAGAAFSSFNKEAFKSYGLGSQTASISREAGEKFAKALNALLASKNHHVRGGNTTYAFWARSDKVPLWAFSPQSNDPKTLREFIAAAWKGDTQWANGLPPEEKFHIFGLTANNGRVVVRSVFEMNIRDLGRRQAEWFSRLEVCGVDGQDGKPLALWHLFPAAYRVTKDVPAGVENALVQAAFTGRHLPLSLLQTLVTRCRIGTMVNKKRVLVSYERAALLKYILVQEGLPIMSELDPDNQSPAYRCGRLLAELEYIQAKAQGKINTTLSDRYFGAASTSPRTVFPSLIRLANQGHLPKIRKNYPNLFYYLQKQLAEIQAPIGVRYPPTLRLVEQGEFALGYYFQRASLYKKREPNATDVDTTANASEDDNDLNEGETE